ncbi:helix-turn-helix domain-containing protein [Acidisoma cladoniae]|uniref:helix-turn-helix domain-containing protein n=1 Tax=Acidisoma cladoniae TaxID=3040935 RepID=UPI00254A45E1|nr:helix-turn-helix domain-containing protein [Acidisoma sp. PAMC 29798]
MEFLSKPMSQPLCPPREQPAGTMAVFSADVVPPARRHKYWLGHVFRRMVSSYEPEADLPFGARLTRIGGEGAEVIEHRGSALRASRDASHCRSDLCDDIILDFIVTTSGASVDNGTGRRLPHAGDMIMMDLSRPLHIVHARHRIISLFLPRERVRSVLADPSRLAGQTLQPRGIVALMRSHMQMTIDQGAQLHPVERVVAVSATVDMALLAIQGQFAKNPEEDNFQLGLYHAAVRLIRNDFSDPNLDPAAVTRGLGCSRATLYRVFGARGESVAKMIWTIRIEAAYRMLRAVEYRNVLIEEIGFRNGFIDIPTFNRMFKIRYSATPSEVRGYAAE